MRSYPALRLGGQVFCGIAALSFFAPFCRDLRFFWLLAALILAASLAAVRLARPLPRLALALVPGLAFLVPVSGWISAAAGAAILLYAAVVLTRGESFLDYRVYRLEGGWILAVCGVLAVVSFFWAQGGVSCFWLPVCAALLVLLALRTLQMGDSLRPAWRAGSLGMLGTVLAAGVLGGLLVWALRFLFVGFFRLLSTGLAYILSFLLGLIAWFWTYVFGTRDTDQDPGLPKLTFNIGGNPKPSSQLITDTHYEDVNVEIPWLAILTVVVVVLLVLAAIRFLRAGGLRRLRKRKTQEANDRASAEVRTRRKKSRRVETDNRSQLRFVYSRYLDYLRARGVMLDPAKTTREITEASADLFLQTDERLRSLYRKARYSEAPVTDEDLAAARELFDRLVADDNRRNAKL